MAKLSLQIQQSRFKTRILKSISEVQLVSDEDAVFSASVRSVRGKKLVLRINTNKASFPSLSKLKSINSFRDKGELPAESATRRTINQVCEQAGCNQVSAYKRDRCT